jgi:hypothetical protein
VEVRVAEINALPFEPYKPVWRQLRKLVLLINEKRKGGRICGDTDDGGSLAENHRQGV